LHRSSIIVDCASRLTGAETKWRWYIFLSCKPAIYSTGCDVWQVI